jgi:hypothetical protein
VCGTSGADGSVGLSPFGFNYLWISNFNSAGTAVLPGWGQTSESNGSTLASPVFSATLGTQLSFYANYVSSDGVDGGGQYDYAWAELFNSYNNPVALLFTARPGTNGLVVPGVGMPSLDATLNPASVPYSGVAPTWSPLGSDSGECYVGACGATGWVRSTYTIPTSGDYYLKFGARMDPISALRHE